MLTWGQKLMHDKKFQVQNYLLEIFETSTNEEKQVQQNTIPADCNEYHIKNLNPSRTYTFKLAAEYEQGRSEFATCKYNTM